MQTGAETRGSGWCVVLVVGGGWCAVVVVVVGFMSVWHLQIVVGLCTALLALFVCLFAGPLFVWTNPNQIARLEA